MGASDNAIVLFWCITFPLNCIRESHLLCRALLLWSLKLLGSCGKPWWEGRGDFWKYQGHWRRSNRTVIIPGIQDGEFLSHMLRL